MISDKNWALLQGFVFGPPGRLKDSVIDMDDAVPKRAEMVIDDLDTLLDAAREEGRAEGLALLANYLDFVADMCGTDFLMYADAPRGPVHLTPEDLAQLEIISEESKERELNRPPVVFP